MSKCDSCVGVEAEHHFCDDCVQNDIESERALRAEVERLTGERDEALTLLQAARDYRAGPTWDDHRERVMGLETEVERLRDLFAAEQKATHAALTRDADQIERLREALRAYGQHTADCGDACGCTCDLDALLEES